MVGAEDGTLGVDDALVGGLRQVIPQPVAGVTAAAVGVGAVDAKQMTLGRKAGIKNLLLVSGYNGSILSSPCRVTPLFLTSALF